MLSWFGSDFFERLLVRVVRLLIRYYTDCEVC